MSTDALPSMQSSEVYTGLPSSNSTSGETGSSPAQSVAPHRGRARRQRTQFNDNAILRLETVFNLQPYPDIHQRETLAEQIGVPEARIQTWFSNKRTRTRRTQRPKDWSSSSTGPLTSSNPATPSTRHRGHQKSPLDNQSDQDTTTSSLECGSPSTSKQPQTTAVYPSLASSPWGMYCPAPLGCGFPPALPTLSPVLGTSVTAEFLMAPFFNMGPQTFLYPAHPGVSLPISWPHTPDRVTFQSPASRGPALPPTNQAPGSAPKLFRPFTEVLPQERSLNDPLASSTPKLFRPFSEKPSFSPVTCSSPKQCVSLPVKTELSTESQLPLDLTV